MSRWLCLALKNSSFPSSLGLQTVPFIVMERSDRHQQQQQQPQDQQQSGSSPNGNRSSIPSKQQPQPQQSLQVESGQTETGVLLTPNDRYTVNNYLNSRGIILRDRIGSGSYSEVFRVVYTPNCTKFALKVINTNTSDHYSMNHLPMEIRVTMELSNHLNIVKVYEIARIEPHLILMVMEFASQGTIADKIAKCGHYDENSGKYLFKQILEGLRYMHSKPIAHRDLKVENLLLTRKNVVKISDFSFATKVDLRNPFSREFCGSLPFFSPQILQNVPYNPLASDVWSVGVCLYVMLNNTIPFNIKHENEMLRYQLERNWKFARRAQHLSQESYRFIARMLEPDVTLRPSTETLLRDRWIASVQSAI